jgi:hypothetical protein
MANKVIPAAFYLHVIAISHDKPPHQRGPDPPHKQQNVSFSNDRLVCLPFEGRLDRDTKSHRPAPVNPFSLAWGPNI